MRGRAVAVWGCVLGLLGACDDGGGDHLAPISEAECGQGLIWTGGTSGSGLMTPGRDCIGCHVTSGEGPTFAAAGTVHGRVDEAKDCVGVEGVTVALIDADGVEHVTTTNRAGNFWFGRSVDLATPYTARVERDGVVREMTTPVDEPNCMACHTPQGARGALGRIVAP